MADIENRVNNLAHHFNHFLNIEHATRTEITINLDDYIASFLSNRYNNEDQASYGDYIMQAKMFYVDLFVEKLAQDSVHYDQRYYSHEKTTPDVAENRFARDRLREIITNIRNTESNHVIFVAYKKDNVDYLYLSWNGMSKKID